METAQLSRTETETAIEALRSRLAGVCGITVIQDHNGASGKAGTTYMTLRFPIGEDLITASFELTQVTSYEQGAEYNRRLNSDPAQ